MLLPNFAVGVISGALSAALIPTFILVQNTDGKDAAGRLIAKFYHLGHRFFLLLSAVLIGLSAPTFPSFSGFEFLAQNSRLNLPEDCSTFVSHFWS